MAATLSNLSSRGVGLSLANEVRYAHLHRQAAGDSGPLPQYWHAGGPFRNLSPSDHERVIRFLFAELGALKH